MAAHQWREFGGCADYPFRRLRECTACGAVQERETKHLWMRVTGYRWEPLAGRCKPGRDKEKAPGRDLLTRRKYDPNDQSAADDFLDHINNRW